MAWIFDTSASFVKGLRQSPVQGKMLVRGSSSLVATVFGVVPVWGYGTFNASSSYGSLSFNDIWPACYQTLTEVWADTVGTATQITNWQPYWDVSKTQTSSGHYGGVTTVTSTSYTSTTFTANYTNGSGSGVYTATVSNPQTVTGSNWATLTAQATALLANQALPASGSAIYSLGGGGIVSYLVAPKSVAPGYVVIGLQSAFQPAALSGVPLRFDTQGDAQSLADTGNTFTDFWPALATILGANGGYGIGARATSPPGIPFSPPYNSNNCGACVSAKTAWQMLGMTSNYSGGSNQNRYPVYALWSQSISNSWVAGTPAFATGITSPFVFPLNAFYTFDPTMISGGSGILAFSPVSQ